MSDPTLKLPIEAALNDAGFRQTEAWLKKLQALQQAAASGGGGVAGGGAAKGVADAGAAAAKSERDILRYANALAASQRAAGDAAGAAATYEQALAGLTPNTLEALQATTKLTQAQNAMAKSSREAAGGAAVLPRTIAGLSHEAAQAATAMLGIGTAMEAIKTGAELVQLGSQANQTRQAFDGLASSAGTTGDALLKALRSASAGTISDLNLELAANRAQLLGVADSAGEFSTLMEIARDRAQKMGIGTTQAFNDLITGLGRGSALILDNLGITVSVTEANESYAKSIGKTVAQLSEAEQKQALINAVLSQGQASIAASGGAMNTMATDVERATAAWENLKAKAGEALATLVAPALSGANQIVSMGDQIEQASQQAFTGARSFEDYAQRAAFLDQQVAGLRGSLAQIGAVFGLAVPPVESLTKAQYEYAQSLIATGTAADAAFSQVQAFSKVFAEADSEQGRAYVEQLMQMGTSAEDAAAKLAQMEPVFQQLSAIQDTATVTNRENAAALAELTPQILEVASYSANAADGILTMAAATASGDLSVENFRVALAGLIADHAANAQATANTTATITYQSQAMIDASNAAQTSTASLVEQTQKTLDASIQSERLAQFQATLAQIGGAVAAGHISAANGAAQLANMYGIATSEAYKLIAAQSQLAGMKAPTGSAIDPSGQQRANQLEAQADAYKKIRAAQEQQVLTTGTAAERQAVLNKQLERTRVTYGEQSAEFINAQTALKQFQDQQDKASRKGGGGGRAAGGGVGAKLDKIRTDEYQKTEDAERQHQERLLAIEQKYAEKSAELLKEGETRKRKSRADFYDALTKATPDIGKDVAGKLAADYEAGFQKARELEQSGQVALARETERANNERLQEELDYQQALADARKAGDEAEVQRLQAIHILRQQEQDERVKQATEGGDQLQADKQKELDSEAQRFEEQTGKIATTADRKAAAVAKGYADQTSAAQQWASAVEAATGRVNRAMESVPNAPGGGATQPAQGDSSGATQPAGGGSAPAAGQGIRGSRQSRGGAPPGQPGNTPGTGSGGGAGSVGNAGQALIEANAVIMQIVQAGTVDKKTLSQLERYQDTIATATAILSRIADLRAQLQAPAPPIPAAMIQALANEAQQVAAIVAGTITTAALRSKDAILKWSEISEKTIGLLKGVADLRKTLADPSPPLTGPLVLKLALEVQGVTTLVLSTLLPSTEKQNKALRLYADAASAAIDAVSAVADLREAVSEPQPPLTGALVLKLAQEAQGVLYIVEANMLPTSEAISEGMQRYADAASAAIGMLAAVADLRKSAAEAGPPLTAAIVTKLAAEALGVLYLVQQQMLPVTEQTGEALQRYADAAGNAIDLIAGVAALRKDLGEASSPIRLEDVQAMAVEAQRVMHIVELTLIPVTEEQAGAIERWTGAAGNALDLLGNVAALRSSMAELSPPLRVEDLARLADEGRRAYEVLATRILPTSEDQAKAAQQWANTVGAAVEALKAPLDLSGRLFADYQSPSDAQLDLLARDAGRVADRLMAAASVYDTKGLEAGKAYADAVGGTFDAFNKGLEFFDRLRFSDLTIDPKNLALFEQGVGQSIEVAGRLGALAATIPAGNLNALSTVTNVLGQAADTMIRLAAVPFGDLGAAIGKLGTGGGGGNSTNVTVNLINPPATMNVALVAQQAATLVKQQLTTDSQGRR